MNVKLGTLGIVMTAGLAGFIAGCPQPPVDLCADVTCEDGFACDAGTGECVAVDPCEGVTCNQDEICVDGQCVAVGPCEGVTCNQDETCVDGQCVPSEPQGFLDANAVRGGGLYDKWWAVTGQDEPTEDHPFWATRPDVDSNQRTGADTWRCKECHGWDYKGVDGAYASGSHRTGIGGIFGTALSAQEAFDRIKDGHGFAVAGLSDDDVWDLAKFVLEGQIDTDEIIDAAGAFIGDAAAGQPLFDDGGGTGIGCAVCHGADGLTIPPGGSEDFDDWVGGLSNDNPWEFQHKVRFGQPGTAMPPQADTLTTEQVADLSAYSQTLPESP